MKPDKSSAQPSGSDPDARNSALDRLMNRVADETATEDDLRALEPLLLKSPEARRRYLRFQDLHAELAMRAEAQAAAALPKATAPAPAAAPTAAPLPGAAAGRIVPFQTRRRWLRPAGSAAAAVLALAGAAVLVWNFHLRPSVQGQDQSQAQAPSRAQAPASSQSTVPTEPAAVAALSHDATLADGRVLPAGAEIPSGPLRLVKGGLGLRFASGAEATLRAPSRFEVVSAMELRIDEGAAAVRAPDPVNGFTVRTPGGALVDLGTEFAMKVAADGSSRMLVREGKVVASLVSPGGSSTRELTATVGQMVVLDAGSGRLDPQAQAVDDFPPRLKLPGPRLQPGAGFEAAMRASAPLAWWRFSKADDGGLVRNEMSPGHWDARAIGGAVIEEAAPGNTAARLGLPDGNAGFLVEETFPGLAENNVFSIELWACAESPGQSTLAGLVLETPAPPAKPNQERHLSVLEIMPSTTNQSGLIHGPNALRFLHRLPTGTPAGVNCISDAPVIPGRWHHLAGVCDGQDLRIYLDGQPVQTVPASPQPWPGAFKLVLGKLRAIPENRERAFKGWIDEAALHRRALTPAEVAAHYQAMEIK